MSVNASNQEIRTKFVILFCLGENSFKRFQAICIVGKGHQLLIHVMFSPQNKTTTCKTE